MNLTKLLAASAGVLTAFSLAASAGTERIATGNVTVEESLRAAVAAYTSSVGEENVADDAVLAKAKAVFSADAVPFDETDLERDVTKLELARLINEVLPADAPVLNDVTGVPDTADPAVLALYRAGVALPVDASGNFQPSETVTRVGAFPLLERLAFPEKRVAFGGYARPAQEAYMLVRSAGMTTSTASSRLAPGFLLDNRGGVPRTSSTDDFGALYDVDGEAGTAYIRKFNRIDSGKIRFDLKVRAFGDGSILEYRNAADEPVYTLLYEGGEWLLDGETVLYTAADGEKEFTFHGFIDLDERTSSTYINRTFCGSYDLAVSAEDANLLSFRYATTDEGTATLSPIYTYMSANYAVWEDFSAESSLPVRWEGENTAPAKGELIVDEGGRFSIPFVDPLGGKLAAEFMLLLPEGESVNAVLKAGDKPVLSFTTDDTYFYVDDTPVYEYRQNLWYRLRFEIDGPNDRMLVKVNGREAMTLPVEPFETLDTFSFENLAGSAVKMDNFRVFPLVGHDDYVPAPVIPDGEEDWLVGVNVCSLWQTGINAAWAPVSPFDDVRPVLGYYDEGSPETADWELKYQLEHGIDFQAFCVYYNTGDSTPLRPSNYINHLYDGYMNAKYSDLSHFAMLWECNAQTPNSEAIWENVYVPYFIENFFKDDRYLVINNKPVLFIYDPSGNIGTRLVSTLPVQNRTEEDKINATKAAFDYLEETIKEYGYDGMYYIKCGLNATAAMEQMGYDGVYAYNWGKQGYSYQYTVNAIERSAASSDVVYTVPSLSVGFNNVGWAATRSQMMSVEDYAALHNYVKNTYLPNHATEDWQQNFVMLSTWNEYGEGTYIMPAGLNGFGYLNAVREAYTSESADASLDTVPTDEQLYRIGHLYPQDLRLLRKEGYVKESDLPENMNGEVVAAVDYGVQGSFTAVNVSNQTYDDEGYHARSIGSGDVRLETSFAQDPLSADSVAQIRVKAAIPTGELLQLFYLTTDGAELSETQSFKATSASDELTEYVFNVAGAPNFSGNITAIRLDPVNTARKNFTVKSLEFLQTNELYTLNYGTGSYIISSAANVTQSAAGISGTCNGDTLISYESFGDALDAADIGYIVVTAKVPKDERFEIFYRTSLSDAWTQDKSALIYAETSETTEYVFSTRDFVNWGGKLTGLRVDPVTSAGAAFTLVKTVFYPPVSNAKRYLTINGEKFSLPFDLQTAGDRVLVPFDPTTGIDFRLNCFFDWNKAAKSLILYFKSHTLVFTVGRTTYTVDGATRPLGFMMKALDGLPLVPLDIICSTVGYTLDVGEDGVYTVETDQIDYFNAMHSTEEGVWNFNAPGDIGGWTSNHLNMMTADGVLYVSSNSSYTDPAMYSAPLAMNASEYKTLEVRMRYQATNPKEIKMYFITDQDTSWNEGKVFKIATIGTQETMGDFVTYRITIANAKNGWGGRLSTWKNFITQLRFDPFNAVGAAEIDYIRFLKE